MTTRANARAGYPLSPKRLRCLSSTVAVVLATGTIWSVAAPAASCDPSESSSSSAASRYIEQGRLRLSQGHFEDALKAYDAALQADPTATTALRGRGEALVKLQRYEEAVRALDEFLKKVPASAETYHLRGLLQTKLGHFSKAIADYTQALKLREDADTYAQRGWVYLASEAPQTALADFEQAIRLNRKDGNIYNGRGLARLSLGQYKAAITDAEEAVLRGSATPRLFLNAARIYAQVSGRLQAEALRDKRLRPPECIPYRERAVQLLRKTLESLPADERATFWRAHLENNTAFDPVRSSPNFDKLEAEANSVTKPKDAPP